MNPHQELFEQLSATFHSGVTRSLPWRRQQLKRMESMILENENRISEALMMDFGKPPIETYTTEISIILDEIRWIRKYLKRFMRPVRVGGTLPIWPGKSRIWNEPYGTCLIFGTWNYPLLLSLQPLATAIGAGNTAILKPSEVARHTADLIRQMVHEYLDDNAIRVITGEVEDAVKLLELPFPKIFFTGSTRVGKQVMAAAAKHLSHLTLELGGKSPTLILRDAPLRDAAKKICWGKFMNAGQTCIAPDYVLVPAEKATEFLKWIEFWIKEMYGENPIKSPDLAGIINSRHLDRLQRLIQGSPLICGGESDSSGNRLAPTVLYPVNMNEPVMQEEIFGPVLPVIPYESLDEALSIISVNPHPLAFYLFTRDRSAASRLLNNLSFGSACVNDVVMQFANPKLPFGGVGPSGMGRYHRLEGLKEFSNPRSVLYKASWFDAWFRYAPFTLSRQKLLRWILG